MIERAPLKDITVVIGPTAIGKSSFAIQRALETGAEIISADAFQVYHYMDIGTAKVPLEERCGVPHHLIDILYPDHAYSVVDFLKRTGVLVQEIRNRKRPVIICGGTGFYIHAFLHGYPFSDQGCEEEIRKALYEEASQKGSPVLWERLKAIDTKAAEKISPNDLKRIVRGLEVFLTTGKKPSDFYLKTASPRQDCKIVALTASKEIIWERIAQRVDKMFARGFIEEVQSILNRGYPSTCNAFEGLGYKEIAQYLYGSGTKEDVIECVKIKTRQFAKRQMTWFKRYEQAVWLGSHYH